MPGAKRTPDQITLELESERAELVVAVGELREALDYTRGRVKSAAKKVPFVVAGATAAAFAVSAGVGATFRLVSGRRKADSNELWRVGRWSLHEDDE
ncbi:MAG TPA: hypothetical protein VH538_08975 [Gaiellaceae bacterium]|jgi:hypothetical protein